MTWLLMHCEISRIPNDNDVVRVLARARPALCEFRIVNVHMSQNDSTSTTGNPDYLGHLIPALPNLLSPVMGTRYTQAQQCHEFGSAGIANN